MTDVRPTSDDSHRDFMDHVHELEGTDVLVADLGGGNPYGEPDLLYRQGSDRAFNDNSKLAEVGEHRDATNAASPPAGQAEQPVASDSWPMPSVDPGFRVDDALPDTTPAIDPASHVDAFVGTIDVPPVDPASVVDPSIAYGDPTSGETIDTASSQPFDATGVDGMGLGPY